MSLFSSYYYRRIIRLNLGFYIRRQASLLSCYLQFFVVVWVEYEFWWHNGSQRIIPKPNGIISRFSMATSKNYFFDSNCFTDNLLLLKCSNAGKNTSRLSDSNYEYCSLWRGTVLRTFVEVERRLYAILKKYIEHKVSTLLGILFITPFLILNIWCVN